MNQPNYLNWPQYDDDLVNKAYVDALGKDINIKEVRQELNTISGNVTTLSTTKLDNSVFNNFISEQYNPLVSNVDSKIESFYQNTDPSTSWSTLLERSTHKGDIWYDTASQRTYVYYEDTSTSPTSYYWQWQNVPTSLIDTVDGKGTIFVGLETPTDPNEGDLWFKSTEDGIYTYVNNQWLEYNKYTDDSALTTFISDTYTSAVQDLQSQIDGKIETWYQSTDPSSAWTTVELKTKHTGDLWFDTTNGNNITKRWNGTQWLEQDVPSEVFDAIDGKAQIFINQPTPPYSIGDLWFNSENSDIMTCITARASGNYTASDWEKRNKYTNDDTANSALDQANDAFDKAGEVESDLHKNYVTTQTFNSETGTLKTRVGTVETDYVKTTTLNQKAGEFNIAINEAKTAATTADSKATTINTTLNNYFKFAQDGLTISVGNSNIKLKIDNDSIDFMNGDKMIATWKIESGNVASSTLNLGQYQFTTRGTGNNQSLDFKHV